MFTSLVAEEDLLLDVIDYLSLASIVRLQATCSSINDFISLHEARIRARASLRIIFQFYDTRKIILDATQAKPAQVIIIQIEKTLSRLVNSLEHLDDGVQLYKMWERCKCGDIFACIPEGLTVYDVLRVICRRKLQGFHFNRLSATTSLNSSVYALQAISEALSQTRIRVVDYPYYCELTGGRLPQDYSIPNAEALLISMINRHQCEEVRLLPTCTGWFTRRLSKNFLFRVPSLRCLMVDGSSTGDIEMADEDFSRLDTFHGLEHQSSLSHRGICLWIRRKLLEDASPGELSIVQRPPQDMNDGDFWQLLRQELEDQGLYGIFQQTQRTGYFLSSTAKRVVRLQLDVDAAWERWAIKLGTDSVTDDLNEFIESTKQASNGKRLDIDLRIVDEEAGEKFYLPGSVGAKQPISRLGINVKLSNLLFFGRPPKWLQNVRLLIFQEEKKSLTVIPTKPVKLITRQAILEHLWHDLPANAVYAMTNSNDGEKVLRDLQSLMGGRRIRRFHLEATTKPSERLLQNVIQQFRVEDFSFKYQEHLNWRLANELFDVTPSLHSFRVLCKPTDDLFISITDSQLQRMLKFNAPHAKTEVTERGVAAWRETFKSTNLDDHLPDLGKASISFVRSDGFRIL